MGEQQEIFFPSRQPGEQDAGLEQRAYIEALCTELGITGVTTGELEAMGQLQAYTLIKELQALLKDNPMDETGFLLRLRDPEAPARSQMLAILVVVSVMSLLGWMVTF